MFPNTRDDVSAPRTLMRALLADVTTSYVVNTAKLQVAAKATVAVGLQV